MRTDRIFGCPTLGNCALLVTLWAALAIFLMLAAGSPVQAGQGAWTLRLAPIQMELYGHDQHVLTIHETDFDSRPQFTNKTAVTLETESNLAYRSELQYSRGQWGWGVDVFWFNTSQGKADRTGSGGASGSADLVVFEIAGQSFFSSDPSEVLSYFVLEDTDIAAWTIDLYARRSLADKPGSSVYLLFGLRTGDFDNDYRAVVGLESSGGKRLDASSNYGLMMGPLVGLVGEVNRGKNHFEGYISQSLLLGSAELSRKSRDFIGPLVVARAVEGEFEGVFAQDRFRTEPDVAIPITDLRLNWTYRLSKHLALGMGVNTATWWDVSVPPGAIPGEDGAEALHENTLVFFGLAGAVELRF